MCIRDRSYAPSQAFSSLFKLKRRKSCLLHRHKSKRNDPRRRIKTRIMRHKVPNHNALLRRIRIVGPRWNRQFKYMSSGKQHLNRNKSRMNLKRKRKPKMMPLCEREKIMKMIPHFKRRKFKDMHQIDMAKQNNMRRQVHMNSRLSGPEGLSSGIPQTYFVDSSCADALHFLYQRQANQIAFGVCLIDQSLAVGHCTEILRNAL
eukprot:TRINITY_DN6011_c0_g1_i4.p1 TRINITY_DN6011_c0_g1~~TRINITY_DN6011_c0_g1_i4.p1  ORF type:complete len:233 (+),score=37.87 TRINITY_DN6011_c0_g1_i4:89-700(+)